MLSWIFIVLAHWNNSPRIDMSPHSDTLSWFRANQSLIFLLNAACLVEKQQIPILLSLVWPDRGSNLRSTALKVSSLTITPSMRFIKECRKEILIKLAIVLKISKFSWNTVYVVHLSAVFLEEITYVFRSIKAINLETNV
jgi:hypothetical protein